MAEEGKWNLGKERDGHGSGHVDKERKTKDMCFAFPCAAIVGVEVLSFCSPSRMQRQPHSEQGIEWVNVNDMKEREQLLLALESWR